MTEQRLPGGRSFGAVLAGDEVRRPAQPWTATVHSVLRHLEDVGFDGAPRARGFDDQGRERLTFLPGQTLGGARGETGPWPDWLRCDDALRQLADGGEPVFQRMLPWAADLERSGTEVAGLPDEFWPEPG